MPVGVAYHAIPTGKKYNKEAKEKNEKRKKIKQNRKTM